MGVSTHPVLFSDPKLPTNPNVLNQGLRLTWLDVIPWFTDAALDNFNAYPLGFCNHFTPNLNARFTASQRLLQNDIFEFDGELGILRMFDQDVLPVGSFKGLLLLSNATVSSCTMNRVLAMGKDNILLTGDYLSTATVNANYYVKLSRTTVSSAFILTKLLLEQK